MSSSGAIAPTVAGVLIVSLVAVVKDVITSQRSPGPLDACSGFIAGKITSSDLNSCIFEICTALDYSTCDPSWTLGQNIDNLLTGLETEYTSLYN